MDKLFSNNEAFTEMNENFEEIEGECTHRGCEVEASRQRRYFPSAVTHPSPRIASPQTRSLMSTIKSGCRVVPFSAVPAQSTSSTGTPSSTSRRIISTSRLPTSSQLRLHGHLTKQAFWKVLAAYLTKRRAKGVAKPLPPLLTTQQIRR